MQVKSDLCYRTHFCCRCQALCWNRCPLLVEVLEEASLLHSFPHSTLPCSAASIPLIFSSSWWVTPFVCTVLHLAGQTHNTLPSVLFVFSLKLWLVLSCRPVNCFCNSNRSSSNNSSSICCRTSASSPQTYVNKQTPNRYGLHLFLFFVNRTVSKRIVTAKR